MILPLISAIVLQNEVDPYLLPIVDKTPVEVRPGLNRGSAPAGFDDLVKACDGQRFLLIGESHDNPRHHEFQARAIRALAAAGRRVVVGFEMFTRPNQANLAPWTLGWWTEDEFIREADWKKQWGFDFGLYRPIFDAVRDLKLPMVALNVPRAWVSAVGKGGPAALTPEQKKELPELYLENKDHRQVFTALMGGHPMTGTQGDNIYAAQVLWDEGMADTALKDMATRRDPKTIMVIIAGSGHVMYGQGIAYRINRRTGERPRTIVCIDGDEKRTVSKGLADFVFVGGQGVSK